MKTLRRGIAVVSIGLLSACNANTGNGDGTCNPACGPNQKCAEGRCVASNPTGGGVDAGDISFTGNPDAGGTVIVGGDAGIQACAADKTRAQQLPLDIYIMLDQSGSMDDAVSGGTKWTAVTSALTSFVNSGQTGVSVGLQYFALPESGSTAQCTVANCTKDADCGTGCGPCDPWWGCLGYSGGGAESCNAADYAKPEVEIQPLPGVAQAIIASMGQHAPSTSTPTSAALQGAVDHVKAWKTSHPNDAVVAILATDGDPMECDTDLTHIDAIAAAGASGTPKALTFVIGVGPSLDALNGIAAAGGTTSAYMVDTGGNVSQQFLDALNKIRGAALGCNYSIPQPTSGGGTVDYNKINVQYTPGGSSTAQMLPQVSGQAACPSSGDAWYYELDASNTPKQIVLCTSTCNKVMADSAGEVDVLVGCKTIMQ